jgi:hypothetical protein
LECWVETDPFGRVTDASPEGARVLNLSVRGLIGRDLSLFFLDREPLARGLGALRAGLSSCPALTVPFRPRDRKAQRMRVELTATDNGTVRWQFSECVKAVAA